MPVQAPTTKTRSLSQEPPEPKMLVLTTDIGMSVRAHMKHAPMSVQASLKLKASHKDLFRLHNPWWEDAERRPYTPGASHRALYGRLWVHLLSTAAQGQRMVG